MMYHIFNFLHTYICIIVSIYVSTRARVCVYVNFDYIISIIKAEIQGRSFEIIHSMVICNQRSGPSIHWPQLTLFGGTVRRIADWSIVSGGIDIGGSTLQLSVKAVHTVQPLPTIARSLARSLYVWRQRAEQSKHYTTPPVRQTRTPLEKKLITGRESERASKPTQPNQHRPARPRSAPDIPEQKETERAFYAATGSIRGRVGLQSTDSL